MKNIKENKICIYCGKPIKDKGKNIKPYSFNIGMGGEKQYYHYDCFLDAEDYIDNILCSQNFENPTFVVSPWMTNGDVLRMIFPTLKIYEDSYEELTSLLSERMEGISVDNNFWNQPYDRNSAFEKIKEIVKQYD